MQVLAGAELYLNLTSLFLLILFSTKFNILLHMVNYYFYIFLAQSHQTTRFPQMPLILFSYFLKLCIHYSKTNANEQKKLTDLSVLHSNRASNPAYFNEMTQCFDMQAKKQELFCLSTKLISLLYTGNSEGIPWQ